MSRNKKAPQMRLVDPSDPDDLSELYTSDEPESDASEDTGRRGSRQPAQSHRAVEQSQQRSDKLNGRPTTATPPPRDARTPSDKNRRRDNGNSGGSGGGLFGRLLKMRKKEDGDDAVGSSRAAGNGRQVHPLANQDRSLGSSRRPLDPLPGPRETLGIDAFNSSRPRSSMASTSLMMLDNSGGTASPASRRSLSGQDAVLKDRSVERQPNVIDRQSRPQAATGQTAQLKRENTARYSIAHSVEASLVDTWSIAEKLINREDDEMTEGAYTQDESEEDEEEWMRSGRPPMVSDGVSTYAPSIRSRGKQDDDKEPEDDEDDLEYEDDETGIDDIEDETEMDLDPEEEDEEPDEDDDETEEGTYRHRNGSRTPTRPGSAKPELSRANTGASSYYDAGPAVSESRSRPPKNPARRSDVDRLLQRLGATDVDDESTSAAGATNNTKPQRQTASDSPSEVSSLPKFSRAGNRPPPDMQSRIGTALYDEEGNESAIMPDDSVSVRAMQRSSRPQTAEKSAPAAAAAGAGAGAAAMRKGGRRATSPSKDRDPEKLVAMLNDMEPEYQSESDEEDEEGLEAYDQGENEDEQTELTEEEEDTLTDVQQRPKAAPPLVTKPSSPARSDTGTAISDAWTLRSAGDLPRRGAAAAAVPAPARQTKPQLRRKRVRRLPHEQGRNTWLMDASLTPEEMQYFVQAMVSSELDWELARAFTFDPAGSGRSAQPPLSPVGSEKRTSSPFGGRQSGSKLRDFEVFRKSKSTVESPSDLPLIRFLFESALCMLPVFGQDKTLYSKRRKRAEIYWNKGPGPLLKILQARSFAHRLDYYGEGEGTAFSAESTMDVILGTLQRAVVSYITATLSIGRGDEAKAPWPWPSPKLMKLPAFTPYRLPLMEQSRGAFEVDIVVMRPLAGAPSFILRVRRQYGNPNLFVIRSEAQFLEYATALHNALPNACVKRPPPPEMAMQGPPGAAQAPHQMYAQPASESSSTAVNEDAKRRSMARTRSGERLNADRSADKHQSVLAGMFSSLGRTTSSPAVSKGGSNQGAGGLGGQERPQIESRSSGMGDNRRQTLRASKSSLPLSPSNSDSGNETAVNSGSLWTTALVNNSSQGKVPIKQSVAKVASKLANEPLAGPGNSGGSGSGGSGGLFGANKKPKVTAATINYDLRRLQLRDWLRDVLTARGVGHHSETREFLSAGYFTDKDLKSSTKSKIAANEELDRASTKQREELALQAGEEVLDLRDQMDAMWDECKYGNGFLQAKEVLERAGSFSALPEDYQRLVSYLHLKVAHFLLGTFVTGDESLGNFRRARGVFNAIPWKLLTLVMTEPTGVMISDLKRTLTAPKFVSRLISNVFGDDQRKIDSELAELKRRLPADYLRKIRRFVEVTPDHTKRLIRDSALKNGIPLVAAIERGSDEPLLEGKELSRIIQATRAHMAFMETNPTFIDIEVEAKVNKDVALILDLQYALRIYSARRDGQNMRDLARSSTFRTALGNALQPFLDHLARLHHRRKPIKRSIQLLHARLEALLDLIQALRTRIQDSAKSIDALTTFLDSHVHDTVALLSLLSPLFPWLHNLAKTMAEGSPDLSSEWAPPASANRHSPLGEEGMQNVREVAEAAWFARVRDMELASRWIAGDLESDQSVQVLGGGGGGTGPGGAPMPERTRMLPILPDEPKRPQLDRSIFDAFMPTFRDALARVLESRSSDAPTTPSSRSAPRRQQAASPVSSRSPLSPQSPRSPMASKSKLRPW